MIEYRIGDVFERLAEIPDDSIDLIVTSPPFLALRSYLPADHPDKAREIGSEATPADFLDTLLTLTAEWVRVLAPHGSLCVELGDTYAGTKAAGTVGNLEGESRRAVASEHKYAGPWANPGFGDGFKGGNPGGPGWPLAKSKTMIDTLYPACLSYGRNLLNGNPGPQLRIRNLIVWARPNPPVGALGDKFRPATSYITVASMGPKRYFDLDAVRHENPRSAETPSGNKVMNGGKPGRVDLIAQNPAGAPPLDWHADDHPEDGDWLWKLSTQPYKGSHYATFPMALPKRLIEAMCPLRVCVTCGKPSERVVEKSPEYVAARKAIAGGDVASYTDYTKGARAGGKLGTGGGAASLISNGVIDSANITLGWTDCEHDNWRTGVVLDPFGGSGTTLEAAQAVGRHAIAIDLDERNAELARERVGMFVQIIDKEEVA